MKMAVNLWIIAVLAWSVTSNVTTAAETVRWSRNLETAQELAQQAGKPLLLHFYADWCAPCQELERTVFVAPSVAKAIRKHAIAVKVDVDAHRDLTTQYGIASIPADVWVTPDGQFLSSRSSPQTARAYVDMIATAKSDNDRSTRLVRQAKRDQVKQGRAEGTTPTACIACGLASCIH